MTTDYKVTELFCIIDEFCKHFDAENAGNLLEDRVKIILYQSNKVVFKVKVLSMFRRRNGDGWKGCKRRGGAGVGHVSGCGGLGIEMRKVRDGASKGQGSRVERWRFVVGNVAMRHENISPTDATLLESHH